MSGNKPDRQSNSRRTPYYFVASIVALYLLVLLLLIQTPVFNAYHFFIRLCALWGATSLFLAVMTTALIRYIYSVFGRPFMKVHHLFSIGGLVLISFHPLIVALQQMNLGVFVPVFNSWQIFWGNAGRLAIILIYLALVAVLLRKYLPRYWKVFHMLVYAALISGAVHGSILGTDSGNTALVVLFAIMLFLSLCVFAYKRLRLGQGKLQN